MIRGIDVRKIFFPGRIVVLVPELMHERTNEYVWEDDGAKCWNHVLILNSRRATYSLNLSSVFHRGPRETATHLRGADAR